MKKGKYAKRGVATKVMLLVLALMLLVGATVGGTIAWLIADTDPLENTFTYGDINITLEEEADSAGFKIVPGNEIEKDPVITVEADSEDCWLFVKVEKSANFDTFMEFQMDAGWTELTAGSGVYYQEVGASDATQSFPVLADDKVIVKSDVTKEMITENKNNAPTLTFTAYAVQQANIDTAAEAWGYANPAESE